MTRVKHFFKRRGYIGFRDIFQRHDGVGPGPVVSMVDIWLDQSHGLYSPYHAKGLYGIGYHTTDR